MPKLRQLTGVQAAQTIANRLGPKLDRVRQIATNLGVRPYNVQLVWSKWTGIVRGEGDERIQVTLPLLPNPKVVDLTSLSLNPFTAGVYPEGSVRVDLISTSYSEAQLLGRALPNSPDAAHITEPWDFWWEISEDGRDGLQPMLRKFRVYGSPYRRPGAVKWVVILQRIMEDRNRDGVPNQGPDE